MVFSQQMFVSEANARDNESWAHDQPASSRERIIRGAPRHIDIDRSIFPGQRQSQIARKVCVASIRLETGC